MAKASNRRNGRGGTRPRKARVSVPTEPTESAAILFADVRGFSRLRGHQLHRFTDILYGIYRQHAGLVRKDLLHANTWGDGLVLVTRRAPPLADFAIQFRNALATYPWERQDLPPMRVRIALHMGEVALGDGIERIFPRSRNATGTDLSLPARIEPITAPGQIYVTEEFRTIAASKSSHLKFTDLGEKELPKGYGQCRLFLLQALDDQVPPDPDQAFIRRYDRVDLSEMRADMVQRMRQFPGPAPILHLAAGDLSVMGRVVADEIEAKRIQVREIHLKRIAAKTAERLARDGMFRLSTLQLLEVNLEYLLERCARLRIPCRVVDWAGVPEVHGVLFGDLMEWGYWQYEPGAGLSPRSPVELFHRAVDPERFAGLEQLFTRPEPMTAEAPEVK